MAKAATARPARRSWFWVQGLVCGIVAATAPGTALMLAVLLGPGMAMYASAPGRGKAHARAMILMGAATVFMPLRQLWEQGGSLDAALALLGDPARPLLSWTASGMGWLIGQVTELATQFLLNAKAAQERRALVTERQTLLDEWITNSGR